MACSTVLSLQLYDPNWDLRRWYGWQIYLEGQRQIKIQSTGFESEYSPYLYNLRGALAMASILVQIPMVSQFYIRQNKDDISDKTLTDPSQLRSSMLIKIDGNPAL